MNLAKEIEKALAASMLIGVSAVAILGAWAQAQNRGEKPSGLRSTIAFVSTRHEPAADPAVDAQRAWLAAEIYLMDGDGTNPRRITENTSSDGFPRCRRTVHGSCSTATGCGQRASPSTRRTCL
jgi:hypothetical protein